MDKLLSINKSAISNKLDKVKRIKYKNGNTLYSCNDMIEFLSESKSRDKRLINDYTKEQVVVRNIDVSGVLRACRFFTILGIERYLNEGKIYSYSNACAYFFIPVKNKKHEQYSLELTKCQVGNKYDTKKLLRWLFEKRKSIKSLGIETTIADVVECLELQKKKCLKVDGDGGLEVDVDVEIEIEGKTSDNDNSDEPEVEYNQEKAQWLVRQLSIV
jgi:hypothetical protein